MTSPGLSSFSTSDAVGDGDGPSSHHASTTTTSRNNGGSASASPPRSHVVDDEEQLFPILREGLPGTTILGPRGCHVYQTIVQENAVGYKVRIDLVEDRGRTRGEEGRPRQEMTDTDEGNNDMTSDKADDVRPTMRQHKDLFVKVVRLGDYVSKKKDWADLRRTLLYSRTDARFYAEILPQLLVGGNSSANSGLSSRNAFTPHVYLARCDLKGWIDEHERATSPAFSGYPAAYDECLTNSETPIAADNKGGWIVLECVDPLRYYQDSPLLPCQSLRCLQAVAKLHAAAWQHSELLENCDKRLSRASFHLSLRNPKELAGIVDSWDAFYKAFESHLHIEGLDTEAFVNLGRRIERLAVHVSNLVSPGPNDKFATLVHGDYKSLNVFLPRDSNDNNCLMVDFASCGVGLGMSDLAMHVRHAVEPHHLAEGGEQRLVRQYWEYLQGLILWEDAAAANEYTWEVAWRHYKLAVTDYFRFFLGRMWKSATPDTMQAKANNKNVSLINRSVPAAVAFLRNVESYMVEIEIEHENASAK